MKWLLTSSTPRHEVYELWNAKDKLLTLNYHHDNGTLRITANDEKRTLLITKKGFLRSRLVLRNEYGVQMGQLNHETAQGYQGRIEVHDEEFSYRVQGNGPAEAAIYQNDQMVTVCELPAVVEAHDLLVLAFCWYIFNFAPKFLQTHRIVEYA